MGLKATTTSKPRGGALKCSQASLEDRQLEDAINQSTDEYLMVPSHNPKGIGFHDLVDCHFATAVSSDPKASSSRPVLFVVAPNCQSSLHVLDAVRNSEGENLSPSPRGFGGVDSTFSSFSVSHIRDTSIIHPSNSEGSLPHSCLYHSESEIPSDRVFCDAAPSTDAPT